MSTAGGMSETSADYVAEQREIEMEHISKEIARCVARHHCHNTDVLVDPYELLDSATKLIAWLEDEIELRDRTIEGHDNWQDDEIDKLKAQLAEHAELKKKVDSVPWLADVLKNMKLP